jgi:hypothetical protein
MLEVTYTPVTAKDLEPGDIFSFEPASQIAPEITHKVIFPDGALAFGPVYLRTEAATPASDDAATRVYRVTVERGDITCAHCGKLMWMKDSTSTCSGAGHEECRRKCRTC